MSLKTITTSAGCKHCGGTVIIEVRIGGSESGGHTASKPCAKCGRTSSYSYTLSNGQFAGLR